MEVGVASLHLRGEAASSHWGSLVACPASVVAWECQLSLQKISTYEDLKLLVDKTSVTAASKRGSVVKFDFWRC